MFVTVDDFRDYVNAPNLDDGTAERVVGTAHDMVCPMLDPAALAGRIPDAVRTCVLMVASAVWRQEQTGSGSWQVDDLAYPSPQAFTSGILRRYAPTYVAWMNVGTWVG